MRPQNNDARTRLNIELRRNVPANAATLAESLNVSIPTIHRIIRERDDEIVRQGTTKNARYALRRSLRGQSRPIPVYAVDANGRGSFVNSLELIAAAGSFMDVHAMGFPFSADHHDWWDGLPYPIYDMKPQGFLGRNFASQIATDFSVSGNPNDWSDDDIAYVLTFRGADSPGNLIIGDTAYELWLKSCITPPPIWQEHELPDRYAESAVIATNHGAGGSSAGGEFPKFTALRELQNAHTPHVIVKFSGADASSAAVQRWSDLLVCEHLALSIIGASTGMRVSPSRIINGHGRTFLEVERFDRVGGFGRLPLVSLSSLDSAFIGSGNGPWPELVKRMAGMSILPGSLFDDVLVLWWYGKLIANNDMHLGNLSFQFDALTGSRPVMRVSPIYDMLPMLYAPLSGGEVPVRQFEPSLPLPREESAWKIAIYAALSFWRAASDDERISQQFRDVCRENYALLNKLVDVN
jgi:hypothetical protein